MSMHQRLRRSTAGLHRQVEASIGLEACLASPAGYRTLLERLFGLYCPVEAALATLDWSSARIDARRRSKSRWLEQDLCDLGLTDAKIERLPRCPRLPELDGMAPALGWLYVLEGATLGGRVILRLAGEALGIRPDRGGRFFSGYGSRTGSMWRECTRALDAIDPREPVADRVEEAAKSMFLLFGDWMGASSSLTCRDEGKAGISPDPFPSS